MYTGGCLCGAVRYETHGAPSLATICHCTTCRRASAAPFVAWFTVPEAMFRITAGSPASYASSDHAVRSFCPRCGTPLTFKSSNSAGEIDVTTCSLDEPERVPPEDHTWTRSRLSWVVINDALPIHEKRRPE